MDDSVHRIDCEKVSFVMVVVGLTLSCECLLKHEANSRPDFAGDATHHLSFPEVWVPTTCFGGRYLSLSRLALLI
jgi:hypothetical protein